MFLSFLSCLFVRAVTSLSFPFFSPCRRVCQSPSSSSLHEGHPGPRNTMWLRVSFILSFPVSFVFVVPSITAFAFLHPGPLRVRLLHLPPLYQQPRSCNRACGGYFTGSFLSSSPAITTSSLLFVPSLLLPFPSLFPSCS